MRIIWINTIYEIIIFKRADTGAGDIQNLGTVFSIGQVKYVHYNFFVDYERNNKLLHFKNDVERSLFSVVNCYVVTF